MAGGHPPDTKGGEVYLKVKGGINAGIQAALIILGQFFKNSSKAWGQIKIFQYTINQPIWIAVIGNATPITWKVYF